MLPLDPIDNKEWIAKYNKLMARGNHKSSIKYNSEFK
jgi:hypothetical protein